MKHTTDELMAIWGVVSDWFIGVIKWPHPLLAHVCMVGHKLHFYTFLAGPPSHPLTNTEAFASMLGQEIVASYQLQSHVATSSEGSLPSPGKSAPLTNGVAPAPLPPEVSSSGATSSPGTPLRAHPFANGSLSQDSTRLSQDTAPSTTNSDLQRLQTIARTESSNAQTLDTAGVAQHIRDILSTNNIGQRLFAKNVLGLSQGTVSELLSKPKHWDKLTEKGRESYRKMYAWSKDGSNVIALKAISPKKGKGRSSFNSHTHTHHLLVQFSGLIYQCSHSYLQTWGEILNFCFSMYLNIFWGKTSSCLLIPAYQICGEAVHHQSLTWKTVIMTMKNNRKCLEICILQARRGRGEVIILLKIICTISSCIKVHRTFIQRCMTYLNISTCNIK